MPADYETATTYDERWRQLMDEMNLSDEEVDDKHENVLAELDMLGRIEGEENFGKLADAVREKLDKIERMLSSEPIDRDESDYHKTLDA